ncbi:hypothetical protein E2C01_013865 [Portunus trituberculatus]|uniref:Uncharacterized protein n=1 Tax=Portunus trituberculatus TaxID=210409 RepID=A0A5B7DHC5_PORTR|nr:hypothetical protein [Portunus trituberculatus]
MEVLCFEEEEEEEEKEEEEEEEESWKENCPCNHKTLPPPPVSITPPLSLPSCRQTGAKQRLCCLHRSLNERVVAGRTGGKKNLPRNCVSFPDHESQFPVHGAERAGWDWVGQEWKWLGGTALGWRGDGGGTGREEGKGEGERRSDGT